MTIPLPFAHIAEAANYCEAFFTAVLYGEMACLKDNKNSDGNLRNVMKDAYISIGEMDAVSAFLDPIQFRSQYLQMNKMWMQIFLEHDVKAYNNSEQLEQYSSYLAESGLYCQANLLPNTSGSEKYDCAWRLGDWSILDDGATMHTGKMSRTLEFEKHHYFALSCLKAKDAAGTKLAVRSARDSLIKFFKQSSFECTKNLYKSLVSLHLLQQIEEFCDVSLFGWSSGRPIAELPYYFLSDSISIRQRCESRIYH